MSHSETRIIKHAALQRDDDTDNESEILVTIYGERIGQKIELDRSTEFMLGRDPGLSLRIVDDSVSRHHCRLFRQHRMWFVEDLKSTNGTYVAGEPIRRRALKDGDLLKVGSTIFKYLSTANLEAAYHEEIYRMAIFDGLTQIHNRRYFDEFTERELIRCRRHSRPLSLLFFDLDHFKGINDNYGHLSGDYALRTLADTVRPRIRRDELLARLGGDEFAVVLPEADQGHAIQVAEDLRSRINARDFTFEGQSLPITVSIGVASLSASMETTTELLDAADRALYRAKAAGRNRVLI